MYEKKVAVLSAHWFARKREPVLFLVSYRIGINFVTRRVLSMTDVIDESFRF